MNRVTATLIIWAGGLLSGASMADLFAGRGGPGQVVAGLLLAVAGICASVSASRNGDAQ